MGYSVYRNQTYIFFNKRIFFQQLIVEEANVKNMNHLRYPEDYVLINDKSLINVTSEKYFANLSTTHLLGIDSINEINMDDFIILSRQEIVDQEITFENLEIDGTFQV